VADANHSPLAQFEIKTLIPIKIGETDLSFTNSSLFMLIAVVAIILFMILGVRRHALVPGRWQSMAEMSYEFIVHLIRDTVGNEGRRYFHDIKGPDFEELAKVAGIPYGKVTKAAEFGDKVATAIAVDGPALVEVDMEAIGPYPPYFKPPPFAQKEKETNNG